jgi:hypothetical protein
LHVQKTAANCSKFDSLLRLSLKREAGECGRLACQAE